MGNRNDVVVIDAKKYDMLETVVDEVESDKKCNSARSSNSCSRRLYGEAATAKVQPSMSWRRSTGWTRVKGQSKVSKHAFIFLLKF